MTSPTPLDALPAWDGNVPALHDLQRQLAAHVRLVDDAGAPPRIIAGLDVGFEDAGATTRAAAVLLDAHTLQPIAHALARVPTAMPYIPGLLSFRELPALLRALGELPQVPDLVFVDGQGIAHPRRLGIAAHLGVATGLPSIGVAKKVLCGTHAPVGPRRGDRADLVHRGEVIGSVLRSKDNVRPLIVSPGHRMDLQGAVAHVLACGRGYRLPEPTRWADRLASRRGEMR